MSYSVVTGGLTLVIDASHKDIATYYNWFSSNEAQGQSALWAELSKQVAKDNDVLAFLAGLPPAKRQPNLFLATVRSLFGTPVDWPTFRSHVLSDSDLIASRMLARSTQTNEPGRCAVLLPLLAQLPQPLALIEVGAAAGLCLLPDRYSYDYGSRQLKSDYSANGPMFLCECSSNVPVPKKLPDVAWRRGLDLNPLDVSNQEEMAWLEMLVWPGQRQRLGRLQKAISVARRDPPRVDRGDLVTDLESILNQVPSGLTAVIFHSAVLNYLPSQENRDRFMAAALRSSAYWISNESPLVVPQIALKVTGAHNVGSFLLSLNGVPVGWTNPHGTSLEWIEH